MKRTIAKILVAVALAVLTTGAAIQCDLNQDDDCEFLCFNE